MDWLLDLEPAVIQGWLYVLLALVALVQAWREGGKLSRWARIRAVVPDAHRLAQKIARQTPTKKDDEFLRQLAKLLRPFGIELDPVEEEALKAMGSAEHQTYKLLRDGDERDKLAEAYDAGRVEAEASAEGKAPSPEPKA